MRSLSFRRLAVLILAASAASSACNLTPQPLPPDTLNAGGSGTYSSSGSSGGAGPTGAPDAATPLEASASTGSTSAANAGDGGGSPPIVGSEAAAEDNGDSSADSSADSMSSVVDAGPDAQESGLVDVLGDAADAADATTD